MSEFFAKMNRPTEANTNPPTMVATLAGFNRLEQQLVNGLVQERARNVFDALGTKAKNAAGLIRYRLRAYRRKYTVYDESIRLDPPLYGLREEAA